jgi:hypothetical protein
MSIDPLTMEQFDKILPPQVKKNLNQELLDKFNQSITDPQFAETFRDNVLGYAHVLKEGKYKAEDYLNAVKYISYKLMGDTNIAAYTKTFPQRYQQYLASGTSDKDIASYVTSYNKGKLVNLIFEQTLIPAHVLNADLYQKAINTQAELMVHAKSEKVRTDAANSLLNHLKPPETTKIELDIGVKESNVLNDLRETTRELAAQQKQLLEKGVISAKDVAKSKIIVDAEYEEIPNNA